MIDNFWNLYISCRFKCYYYEHYKIKSSLRNIALTAISIILSMVGLITLLASNIQPGLCASVLVAGQILLAINHLLPYSKTALGLSILIPEIEFLLAKMNHDWNLLRTYTDQEINNLILEYENEYLTIENRITSGLILPRDHGCAEIATKETHDYANARYATYNDDKLTNPT